MFWLPTLPVFIAAVAVVFLPGAVTLLLGGVRGLNVLALAAPISLSYSAGLAVVYGLLSVPFTPITFSIGSLLIALLVWALRILWLRLRPGARGQSLAMNRPMYSGGLGRVAARVAAPAGLLVGAFFVIWRLTTGIGSPEQISQTFDNVFHLSAIHHIAETQNGSSLTIGNLTEASAGFYPAAMHDMFALVQMVTGASVPSVLNVCTIVVAALVWPLGIMFLATRVIGARPVPIFAAGVLAAGLSGFPYLLIGFGVLYSLFMAFAVLPAALGLCIELAGLSFGRSPSWVDPAFWLLLVLPGLTLAHPSALVALLLFCVPLFAARTLQELQTVRHAGTNHQNFRLWLGLSIVFGIVFTAVWLKVRPNLGAAPWNALESTSQAIGEVIASAPIGAVAAWVVMLFTAIGVYTIARWQRQRWWVLAIYFLGGILHVFAAGWGSGTLRTFMVGVWYNDPFRPAALLPLVTLPVALVGVDATYRWIAHRLAGRLSQKYLLSPRLIPVLSAVAVLSIVVGLSQSGTLSSTQKRITESFALDSNSRLLDTDELHLLLRVADSVPEGGRIVVNPLTGASLAYAISDREVIPPHMFGKRSPDEQFLMDHWQEAAYNQDVCPIVQRLNAYWALDFGDLSIYPTNERHLGLGDLPFGNTPGVRVVDSEGDARLLELTVCWEPLQE